MILKVNGQTKIDHENYWSELSNLSCVWQFLEENYQ